MTRMNRWVFVVVLAVFLSAGVIVGSVRAQAPDEPRAPDKREAPKGEKRPEKPLPLTVVGLPSEKPQNKRVQNQLEDVQVSFTFNQQPVMEALDFLQTLGNINIVPDRAKFENPDQTVTLKLTNVSLEAAVRMLTEQLDLKYVVRDGVVFISDEEGVKMRPVWAVYDVADLLKPRTGYKQNPPDRALNDLIELIKATIEPGTWGGRNAIRGLAGSGTFVVTHTPQIHGEVQKLLAELRRTRGIQTRGDAAAKETVTYDLKDLVIKPGHEAAKDFETMRELMVLTRLITDVIEPGSWGKGSGHAIKTRGTSIIVTHRPDVHRRVRQLLDHLRKKNS